jgi:short-subunit dehydrogenase
VDASLEHGSLEDLEWLVGVNLWGVLHGCKFFLPHLLRAGTGHIVNVSSAFGLVGVPLNVGYCATKFAVRGLSDALRAELSGTGVSVTCVHPGGSATNIARSTRYAAGDGLESLRERTIRAFDRMPPPEIAARAIVRGIERDRVRVLVTLFTHVIDVVTRLFPTLSVRVIGRLWRGILQ